MIRCWERVQNLVGRVWFCLIVLAAMGIDRISQGGPALARLATEPGMDPQHSLVSLITLLIGGSLSMMALGYRSRG
ncbi:MAG TPA: hypothetical protein VFF52_15195 [Isosphaeraceae bacterium]|nr:hypothetical protein [Isosphaeraceae bacterium]